MGHWELLTVMLWGTGGQLWGSCGVRWASYGVLWGNYGVAMGQLWGVARQLWGTVSSYGPAVGRGGALFPPPPRWRRHFRRGSARNGGVAAGGHVGSRYDLINGRVNERPAEFPKKRKRSRWNQDSLEQKTVIPGMPTVIPPGLTREQERAYIGNAARRHLGLAGHVGGHVGGGGAEFGSGGEGEGWILGSKMGILGVWGRTAAIAMWCRKRRLILVRKSVKLGFGSGCKSPIFGAAWCWMNSVVKDGILG